MLATALRGFNTKQWWAYIDEKDVYVDPPADVLDTLKQLPYEQQENTLNNVLATDPDWLFDVRHWYTEIEDGLDLFLKTKNEKPFEYYEVEFGIRADGAQTADYEAHDRICIMSYREPSIEDAEKWLADEIVFRSCDCVHSITKMSKREALSSYGFNGTEPIWGD